MQVAVIAWGQELPLEVGTQEPVLDIKAKIEQLLAIPATAQTLAVSGWELFDGLDMEDYPIVTEGTKIELTIKPMFTPPAFNNHYNEIQVVVTLSSKQIVIQVDATDTVGSLKEKIHIVEGTPIKRMSLFFSGIELKDHSRYLTEYGIKEFSEIIVFLKAMGRIREDPPGSQLHIVVQTSSLLNAASIPMEIKDSTRVNELRQLLLSTKILPQDDYLFIHKQRIMRDTRSLRWHGVEDGESLYVFKGTVSRSGS
ncbi:hypothetical protein K2173_027387 [Erythroxylum novogranatense]|uniref:Ubiquitin-like domain-containing protein n=1 Tax=Erythroxylum novogranatense TaxID=1862640 RepID=A0AAV8TZ24_9ROSI|nr:hypothetical protein K2173_027387 [Erythroxylum novogranatense]